MRRATREPRPQDRYQALAAVHCCMPFTCLTRLPLRGIKKEKQTRAAFIGKRPERQKHKRERGREREKTLICIERPRSDTNVGVME